MKIPLISLIIQGIPESIATYTLAFVIARVSLEWKRITLYGVFGAFCSYIIRLLPITFGVHTIILIGLQFFILTHIAKVAILTSLKASLISFLALVILETTFITLLIPLCGINFESFSNSVTIRILITLPQVFGLFFLAFIIHKYSTHLSSTDV